jgi:dihydropteroate synthase
MLSLEQLAEIWEKHRPAATVKVREFSLGSRRFSFNSAPAIMGVINLSPDSWYRESVCLSAERAIERGRVLHAQGAQIVDVGAESTLDHAARVNENAQTNKLLPVVKALASEGILVSVETYQAQVARVCLEAGAKVINLTGMQEAAEIFRIAAAHEAAVILCFVQGPNVREAGEFDLTGDVVGRMRDHFSSLADLAAKCGVERIVLDPGLGFYYRNLQDGTVRVRHQMTTFLQTFRLRELGFPVCHALPHAFEHFGEEVRCAEPFFAVLAAWARRTCSARTKFPRVRAVLDTMSAF